MTTTRLAVLLLLPAILGTGCVAVDSTTRTWSEQPGPEEQVWYGQVSQVREIADEYRGDPAAGAVAGAVVGGILGEAFSGGRGGGFYGALTGAMIGADASRYHQVRWRYEVTVRFDEGSLRTYVYSGQAPFRVGDQVVLSTRGLTHR